MNMKKKVKCKCSQCGKIFLTTRADKLIMTYYSAIVCKDCMAAFYDKVMDRIAKTVFGGKDNEQQ